MVGKSTADDYANTCTHVQARVNVYVGPGSTYSYGPVHPSYSAVQVSAGFISASSKGRTATGTYG